MTDTLDLPPDSGNRAANGDPRSFPSLADRPRRQSGATSGEKLQVCVVTSEFLGPTKNGGIGTATTALVNRLAETGHKVTVLYTQVWGGRPLCQEGTWDEWVGRLRQRGIRMVALDHNGAWYDWREKAWSVRRFLESHDFGTVYLNEHHASGFYALMAKRADLAPFRDQTYITITHGSMEWVSRTNDQPLTEPREIAMALMERRCVEWSDHVIGPSAYLLNTYRDYGWALPNGTFVQPYLLGADKPADTPPSGGVDEIVFFGRLEHRKGLWMFCQALDRLAARGHTPAVTFLGRMTPIGGIPSGAFLLARAARWPFKLRLLTDYGQEQALAYLGQPSRLAVMPSLADNSPCVVYECIERGIPFLTCRGTGADEIIAPEDHGSVLVEPTAEALAERLETCLRGRPGSASYAFDPLRNLATWDEWHADLAGSPAANVPAWPAEKPGEGFAALLVDEPAEPLSALFETLTDHAQMLGPLGEIILATPRGGELGEWLDEVLAIISGTTGARITRAAPENVGARLQGLSRVAVLSATTRLLEPPLRHALALMDRSDIAAVSTLAAGRPDNPVVRGHALPLGELSEMAALGHPLTGGTCIRRLDQEGIDALQAMFTEAAGSGDWPDAAEICEEIALQVMSSGGNYRLVPQIGAVFASPPRPGGRSRWFQRAASTARFAGFEPRRTADLPVWLAVSRIWHGKAAEALTAQNGPPPGLPGMSLGLEGQIAVRAAERGLVQTALDSSTALGEAERDQVRQRIIERMRAVRPADYLPGILKASAGATTPLAGSRRTGNRLKSLRDGARRGKVTDAAIAAERRRLMELARKAPAPPPALRGNALGTFLGSSDPGIDCTSDGRTLTVNFPAGGPALACLVAFDLEIDGQEVLTIGLVGPRTDNSAAITADCELLDQANGTPAARPPKPGRVQGEAHLHVPLGGMTGKVTMVLRLTSEGLEIPAQCRVTRLDAA